MKSKYTKTQIAEAIQYWNRILKLMEATGNEPKPNHGEMSIQKAAKKVTNNSKKNLKIALKALSDDNYEAFIKDLNDLATNDNDNKIVKLRDAIVKHYNEGGKSVSTTTTSLEVTNLRPTQSEVDMEKSLAFPLKKDPAKSIPLAFSGKPIKIGPPGKEKPIVVAEVGGKYYVIDGHHRWSQIYCLNPYAVMSALVIKSDELFKSPNDVLKYTQMQIFIDKKGKEIPQETADSGYNLYTIDEGGFRKWCAEAMETALKEKKGDSAAILFKNAKSYMEDPDDKDQKKSDLDYLWKNVETMRESVPPIKGAHKRDDMPQTGYTKDKLGNVQGKKALPLSERKIMKEKIMKKKIMNESFKNAILGFLRIRSNMTEFEDLVDAINSGNFRDFPLQKQADKLAWAVCDLKASAKNGQYVSFGQVVSALQETLNASSRLKGKAYDPRYTKTINKIAQYIMETIINKAAREGEISRRDAERAKEEARRRASSSSISPTSHTNGNGWLYDPASGGWTFDDGHDNY